MSELFSGSPFPQSAHSSRPVPSNNNLPPPPPAENEQYSVRTLAGDIAQMGGSSSRLGAVPFRAPVISSVSAASQGTESASDVLPSKTYLFWIWSLVGLCAVAALFAAGYYLLPGLFGSPTLPPAENNTPSLPAAGQPSAEVPAPPVHPSFISSGLYGSADLILGRTGSFSDFAPTLLLVAGNASTSSSELWGVSIKDTEGKYWAWPAFSSFMRVGTGVPYSAWRDFFESEFNVYVRKDPQGLWPAYVLRLKSEDSLLAARNQIIKLEESAQTLGDLFAVHPGEPITNFEDAKAGSHPIRSITYAQPGARLVYGWIKSRYLVIAASLDAFQDVAGKLE